jgi:catalase
VPVPQSLADELVSYAQRSLQFSSHSRDKIRDALFATAVERLLNRDYIWPLRRCATSLLTREHQRVSRTTPIGISMTSIPSPDSSSAPLRGANKLARLTTVGMIVLGVGIGFTCAGGWLSPHKLTPAHLIDTFEQINGVHPGFRRNHAKGVCFRGTFEANGQGARLSKAVVFRPGKLPVVGRFALAGGMPYAADTMQTVRSMALRFSLPNGEEWRTGMNSIPVFAVNSPEAFREQLIAMAPETKTGKPDPTKAKAFLARHPESARAIQTIKAQPTASGFDNTTFNSLNAFEFIDAAGRSMAVRWSMVPLQPFAPSVAPLQDNPNFLFDALIAQVKQQPLQWRLVITIGQPGDSTRDATIAWPNDRERVDVGTVTVSQIETEETSPVRAINFDPLVLPNGIAGSDDPLLSARSAAYSQSFIRRMGEPQSPSAVSASEIDK